MTRALGLTRPSPDQIFRAATFEAGFDEVQSGEHLTNGDTVASAEWTATNDLTNAGGKASLTVTDNEDANLTAFFAGELLAALQVLTPLKNREMSAGLNWVNNNLNTFNTTNGHIWSYGDAAGKYFKLDSAYAPMVADQIYEMTLYNNGQIWTGDWEFQDYGGRSLALTSDTPKGDYPGNFIVTQSDGAPDNWVYKFTAPSGTSGGFRVVCYGGGANGQYWDNFALVNVAAKSVAVGLVFKVTDTGDTGNNDLQLAKGSAPANKDLFVVTNTSTPAILYIGNDKGSYAFGFGHGSATSTLIQTASNRTTVGSSKGKALKEYKLTYTVAIKQAIAPAGALALTLETFSAASIALPITAGAQEVYFKAASGANTADFKIQAVGSSVTAGVLELSAFTLYRCCDGGVNPENNEWIMIRALEADAIVSATAVRGDDLASVTLLESSSGLRGNWSRILCTSGKIVAYRI